MNGSGKLPTKYSFGVCRGQVDGQLNIHSVYAGVSGLLTKYSFGECNGQVDYQLDIH